MDEWFVFANESLHYGECRKNPCLNKKLSDIERRTLVPTRTMLKMIGLTWINENSVHLPYEPFWFLDKISAGECRSTFTSSNSCEKNETLAFFGTDPEPECRFVIAGCFTQYTRISGIPSRENSCPYNYRKEGNDCVKQIKLNFNVAEDD
jgi:hypothetical protein